MTLQRDGDDVSGDAILFAIHRQLDGDLEPGAERRLEESLATRSDLAAERHRLRRLREALEAERISVDPGFERRVMAALPATPAWAAAGVRSWAFPIAVGLALAAAAIALLVAGAGVEAVGSGVASAVADFFTTAALAGAGLLAASWRGAGMALGEALSGPAWIVFGVGVLALDLLLLQLLRRRRSAARGRAAGDD